MFVQTLVFIFEVHVHVQNTCNRALIKLTDLILPYTFHRHSESTEYTVLYTRRCRAKLNQLFITRCKN